MGRGVPVYARGATGERSDSCGSTECVFKDRPASPQGMYNILSLGSDRMKLGIIF